MYRYHHRYLRATWGLRLLLLSTPVLLAVVDAWCLTFLSKRGQARSSTSTALTAIAGDSILSGQYAHARDIRSLEGHEAAKSFYRRLLEENPDDRTAGTRIAAASETPWRHDQACGGRKDLMKYSSRIRLLREVLLESQYDHENIANFFGVQYPSADSNDTPSCSGPLFASPVHPGSISVSNYPVSLSGEVPSALSCLIGLFLLSLAVPTKWLHERLGRQQVEVMEEFGWIYPCSIDPSLTVPYVHVFPLEFRGYVVDKTKGNTLYLTTDLHPRVLSTISVGTQTSQKGNAVMYIGPDSLALAQHFDPYTELIEQLSSNEGLQSTKNDKIFGLDLGTGSGVQALSAVWRWMATDKRAAKSSAPQLHILAVDVNPRALRFTQFNAILNAMESRIALIEGDLLTEICSDGSRLEDRLQTESYQFVLANPPFLPVPDRTPNETNMVGVVNQDDTTVESIGSRYGLFSSGGASGESVLQKIVELASRHLVPGGILGVVSEFFYLQHDPQFKRVAGWWKNSVGDDVHGSRSSCDPVDAGVLFVNESPIDAETYASRRADTLREKDLWMRHLLALNVTRVSPGILYIKRNTESVQQCNLELTVSKVPKTDMGSIWTPSNLNAIRFTKETTREHFRRQQHHSSHKSTSF